MELQLLPVPSVDLVLAVEHLVIEVYAVDVFLTVLSKVVATLEVTVTLYVQAVTEVTLFDLRELLSIEVVQTDILIIPELHV